MQERTASFARRGLMSDLDQGTRFWLGSYHGRLAARGLLARPRSAVDLPSVESMEKGWLVPGGACEVLMQEEGLWGSHYTAKILEVTKQKSKIEFEVRNALHSATHPSVGLRQE